MATPPPRWLESLVGRLLPTEARDVVLGDLAEEYRSKRERVSSPVVWAWYLGAGTAVAIRYATEGLFSSRGRWRDTATTLRRLRRSPGFVVLAVAGIGLGVGANAVTLSLADGVFFAPLPFPESERLALLTYDFSGSESDDFGVSYRDLEELRSRATSFDRVAAIYDWQSVDLLADGEPRRLSAAFLGPGYLDLLGVQPVLGRSFTPEENREGAGAPVALLSRELWRSSFGGDPGILGRSLTLNGTPVRVVGVLPGDAFDLRQRFGGRVDVFLPLFAAESVLGQELGEQRGPGPLNAILRLRPGAGFEEGRTELTRISTELAAAFPDRNEGWSFHIDPLTDVFYSDVRTPVSVLLAGSALVFLLVGFNLTGLLLVRSLGRRSEFALRRVLGSPPGRILRLAFIEATILCVAGGVAGLGLAYVGVGALGSSSLLALPSFAPVRLTGPALGVTLLFLVLLTVGLGVVSATPSGWTRPGQALRHGDRTTGDARSRRSRTLLVMGELGVAFALLVVAGLLVRSLDTLVDTDVGFEPDRLLTAKLQLRGDRYDAQDARRSAARQLVESARGVRGVEEAFLWSPNAVGEGSWVDLLTREDRWDLYPAERLEASRHHVHPGGVEAAGIRIVAGRDFTAADDGESPEVALVSESLARRLWPGEDAVGKRLESRPDELRVREVVGVVEDAHHRSRLADPFGPQLDIYYPFDQWPQRNLTLGVRFAPGADPAGVADGLRSAVSDFDAQLPLYEVETMAGRMREEEARSRLVTFLVGGYALLAALLASLGIYGVLAQSVRDRTREIGIRKALGAEARTVMVRVAGAGLAAIVPGVVVGVLLVLAAERLLAGALYGVSPWDPVALGGALLLLLVVGVVASAAPALRASAVEPMEALRES